MKARFLEAARDELRGAVKYYEAQRPGLGSEFRDRVRSAIERIEAFPDAWQLLSENTRRCRTEKFPYGVIYRAGEDGIVIVAIAHLHREPEHWKDRL